jgi:hypothetical protein
VPANRSNARDAIARFTFIDYLRRVDLRIGTGAQDLYQLTPLI